MPPRHKLLSSIWGNAQNTQDVSKQAAPRVRCCSRENVQRQLGTWTHGLQALKHCKPPQHPAENRFTASSPWNGDHRFLRRQNYQIEQNFWGIKEERPPACFKLFGHLTSHPPASQNLQPACFHDVPELIRRVVKSWRSLTLRVTQNLACCFRNVVRVRFCQVSSSRQRRVQWKPFTVQPTPVTDQHPEDQPNKLADGSPIMLEIPTDIW